MSGIGFVPLPCPHNLVVRVDMFFVGASTCHDMVRVDIDCLFYALPPTPATVLVAEAVERSAHDIECVMTGTARKVRHERYVTQKA